MSSVTEFNDRFDGVISSKVAATRSIVQTLGVRSSKVIVETSGVSEPGRRELIEQTAALGEPAAWRAEEESNRTVRTSSENVARPAGLEPATPGLEVPRKEATGGSAKPL